MENESKVVMSLDDYTKLILENNNLKLQLSKCRRNVRNELMDGVKDDSINKLSNAECKEILDSWDDKKLVSCFVYSWKFSSATDNWACFTKDEMRAMAAEIVRNMVKDRESDTRPNEEENQ